MLNNSNKKRPLSHDSSGDEWSREEDSFSLVKLAAVFARYWKLIISVFILVFVGVAGSYFVLPEHYDFVSVYQVAEGVSSNDSFNIALEPPEAVVEKINALYMGETIRGDPKLAEDKANIFRVEVSKVPGTKLVRLSSVGSKHDAELVKRVHSAILQRVDQDQKNIVERYQSNLRRQLDAVQKTLEEIRRSPGSASAAVLVGYSDQVFNLQMRLEQLRPGEIIEAAGQSINPVGLSRNNFILLALMLAVVSAFAAVLMKRFVDMVRQNITLNK